jgi:phospho-N-acetylmuramoyl-pentapeptide-transferase
MSLMLVELLKGAGFDYGFLRIFEYLTFRLIAATLTPLVLLLILGNRGIVILHLRRFRDIGGEYAAIDTASKRGTSTAGGTMLLVATLFSIFVWGDWSNPFLWAVSGAFLYFGFVGYLDDALKVRFKSGLSGLSQIAKTLLQLAFIVPFAYWFVSSWSPLPEALRTTLWLPFYKYAVLDLGPWLQMGLLVFVFYAIVNAVNITDGLDGLVTGPSVSVAAVYGTFAVILGSLEVSTFLLFVPCPGASELAVFSGALVGALLGFLWYNAYPAEVFMGDTGSMAIGAALAVLAWMTRQEMLFPLVGGIFVMSIASSLIQEKIGMRLGRRIFLRAPVHHGWTYKGISEPKVVVRYWIISVLLGLFGLLSIKVR